MQSTSRNSYDLTPVRCPGKYWFPPGVLGPCPVLIDRREVVLDKAVHEARCQKCKCLYVYEFNERGELVVLSMLIPPRKRSR